MEPGQIARCARIGHRIGMRVLVVDDQTDVLDLLERALRRDDHVVYTAGSTREARAQLDAHAVDLIVLDLGLPDGSGEELCRALRAEGHETSILILTARNAVASRVECLDAGADDYLGKPFAVAELRARVRALGRRRAGVRVFVCEHGGLQLDFSARRALRDGKQAPITAREWSILEVLATQRGRVVSKRELLDSVWGDASEATAASLEVLIARIRRKLGPDAIRTVRGEGYAFAD
jgi:DNA-binding response OmpR family regulator